MVATSSSLAAVTSTEELEGCVVGFGLLEMPAACNPCNTEVVIVVTRDGKRVLRKYFKTKRVIADDDAHQK